MSNGHRRREVGLLVAPGGIGHLDHRFAGRAREAEQLRDPADIVGSEDGVHMRRTLEKDLTILLSETAPDRNLQIGTALLDRLQLAEVPVKLVVGVLPDAAGV